MASAANAPIRVEVAVDSMDGAEIAAAAGADRLELCQSLREGGLTPSLGVVELVRAAVRLPIVVMIRPRSGDFLYTRTEFAAMLRDVAHLRRAGANGIVAGVLTAAGELDAARMRELIDAAHPLPVTCHRAFDLCADAMAALDALIALGIARVLTSGQAAAAPAGAAAIRSFVQHARSRLVVMAGAGVRDSNVRELVGATGVQEVHLSATAWTDSAMTFRRPGVPMGSSAPMEEYACRTTDGAAIGRVIANLRRPSA